jgi:hypothetical protein
VFLLAGGAVLGQPYQKAQHYGQAAQKHGTGKYGAPGHPPYQQPQCPPYYGHAPCSPPCDDEQPKDAEHDQPKDAVPGISPGVFVAPQQSGVVEGPSRGVELPTLSFSLPELTLSLPRLKFHGMKHMSRDARMITDSNPAPYVANPYYAMALASQRQAYQNRDAKRDADDEDKDAEQDEEKAAAATQKGCSCDGTTKEATYAELENRIKCFEQQVKALQGCIDDLKRLNTNAGDDKLARPPVPPCNAGNRRNRLELRQSQPAPLDMRFLPASETNRTVYGAAPTVREAQYFAPLRRLPGIRE